MRTLRQASDRGSVTLYDFEPALDCLCEDVARGLTAPEKLLPPKYFYDEPGAHLFERICELDAYYLTRTEIAILNGRSREIADRVGPAAKIVEFGSGSGIKTRILLEHLSEPAAYVPVDISRTQLVHFALSIAELFPALEVLPVCADYTGEYHLPAGTRPAARTVAFFPGSTIGNFQPDEAASFLSHIGELCGPGGGLLIGVDLKKDPRVIQRAYDDPEGVTAAFNLNLLERINRECGADFDTGAFMHRATYDEEHGRIEMRLVSCRDQIVRLNPAGDDNPTDRVFFSSGEAVITEYSYKYSPEQFTSLAKRSGWTAERMWTDERRWFAVFLLCRSLPEPS